jgi:hypothetical protein
MIEEGQIVLFTFPQTDQRIGAVRSALLLRRLPRPHDDWLGEFLNHGGGPFV